MDPSTMMLIVGTGAQMFGAMQEGEAAAIAGEYNARLDEQNARIARDKAKDDERRLRIDAEKQIGQMRASYGASGITIEGSALAVLEESARNAEFDALTVRHQGEAQSTMYTASAQMNRFAGRTGRASGQLGALGAAASGGANYLRRT